MSVATTNQNLLAGYTRGEINSSIEPGKIYNGIVLDTYPITEAGWTAYNYIVLGFPKTKQAIEIAMPQKTLIPKIGDDLGVILGDCLNDETWTRNVKYITSHFGDIPEDAKVELVHGRLSFHFTNRSTVFLSIVSGDARDDGDIIWQAEYHFETEAEEFVGALGWLMTSTSEGKGLLRAGHNPALVADITRMDWSKLAGTTVTAVKFTESDGRIYAFAPALVEGDDSI